MFAIITTGGKQYKVKSRDLVEIEKLELDVGSPVTFDKVLASGEEGGALNYGSPLLAGATVTAKVADQFRAKKVWAFKMKRRKSYRRTIGHRQNLTLVEIGEIKG